jgi:hypothetical protein
MPVVAAFGAIGTALGASAGTAAAVGGLATASVVGGGISSAIKGSAARKQQAAANA